MTQLLTGKWFDNQGSWVGDSVGDSIVIQYARCYGLTVDLDERTERIVTATAQGNDIYMTDDDWRVLWALGDQALDYLNTLTPAGHTAGWKSDGSCHTFGVWED